MVIKTNQPENTVIQRLTETFAFFRTYFIDISKFLLAVTFPVILLEAFGAYYLTKAGAPIEMHVLPSVIAFIYQPVYTAGLIYLISRKINGKTWNLKEGFSFGLTCWGNLLFVNTLTLFITLLGLFAFILPGLFLFARLSMAQFCVVLERLNPKEALIRSNQISKPFTFQIIGCSVFITLTLLIIDLLLQYFFGRVSLNHNFTMIITSVIFLILSANITILLFRFYDLAIKKDQRILH